MIYTKKLIILTIALVVLGLSFSAVLAKKDKDDDEHHTPRPTATPTASPTASPVPTQEPTASPSATPFSTPIENETPRPVLGKDPPEKSDPCYYIQDKPECKTRQEVFPGEPSDFTSHGK